MRTLRIENRMDSKYLGCDMRLSLVFKVVFLLCFATIPASAVLDDFDGDGKSDLAVYQPSTGNWFIRTLSGKTLAWHKQFGYYNAKPVPADYDGDGKTDLAVYDPGKDLWYIKTLDNKVLAWGVKSGISGAIPVPGDYDGDGKADLGVYVLSTGNWYVKTLQGQVIFNGKKWGFKGPVRSWENPPTSTVLPMPYDYDKDGKTDLAIYYRGLAMSDSGWYIRGSTGKNYFPCVWGSSGSIPAPGTYRSANNPYPAGVTTYRVISGTFNTPYMFEFGLGTYKSTLPVSAHDFDGNGWDDHATYNYITGSWKILLNDGDGNANQSGSYYVSPPMMGLQWGFNGAVPADIYTTIYWLCKYSLKPW